MKKYAIITATLVLTLSLLTGCGCTAKDSGTATMPSTAETILPTNIPETTMPTEAATEPMTTPATGSTDSNDATGSTTLPGTDEGMSNDSNTETGARNRSRMH